MLPVPIDLPRHGTVTTIDNRLAAYAPTDAAEQRFKTRMLALLADEPRAFWRDVFAPGHFTGSALVTNPRCNKVLLMKHRYIGRWMQFGGHADGLSDLSKVALREASEESGFPGERFTLSGRVFDIDIHPIPANPHRNEPAHEHFDVRYLLKLDDTLALPPNPEGLMLRWLPLDEAAALVAKEQGLLRMLAKLADR
jgi:8-oxo-dGTP pyrophosphatase MutT (NUDIX family)